MKLKFVLYFFTICFFSSKLWSYPELSRHGYTNCTSCHVSPSGGGLLNLYGRELSKEILRTWSKDKEQYFAYNSVPFLSQNEKLLVGAYVRGLQMKRVTSTVEEARSILMQADIEVGYSPEKWAVVATAGRQEIRSGQQSDSRFFSRRHFALYRVDEKQNIRFGKFLKYFGLSDPNHNLYVRRDLQLGFDTESYNLEYSFFSEKWSLYLTGIFGSFGDQYSQTREKGISSSLSYFFDDKQKVGFSFLKAADDNQDRYLGGLWTIYSFSKKIFLLSELDYQEKTLKSNSAKQAGFATSNRLNYEWYQGVISFILAERKFLNQSDPLAEQQGYGLGVQLFPRPHFEIFGAWQRDEVISTQSRSDLYWVMLHFYL